jgi:hypothetical protein
MAGPIQIGSWLQINVTKPEGEVITLTVTNQTPNAAVSNLTAQLIALVNSAPGLQDLDGVRAEDFTGTWSGSAAFNLYSRGQGYKSAVAKVSFDGSGALMPMPANDSILTDNLADLQPRNHLYVAAGISNLAGSFPLNTASLPDGYHELTAVAYEGSHVRTQTRITVPVRIQNTSLSATLDLLDLPDTASAQGVYHIQVAANTGNVRAISLFSTGGALNIISNQASTIFTVNGPTLGVGLHPFYAVVETTGGSRYRTQTKWVRLTP